MLSESLAAVLSLEKILKVGSGSGTFKILKSEILAAGEYENKLRGQIRQWVRGSYVPSDESTLKMNDVMGLVDSVLAYDSETARLELTRVFNQEGIPFELIPPILNVAETLKAVLPADIMSETTLGGSARNPELSTSLRSHFLWAARIAENPMWLVSLLDMQQIAKKDVDVINQVFPEIYGIMLEEAMAVSIELYNGDQRLPRRLRLPLSVLAESPIVTAKQAKAYEEHDTKKSAPEAPGGPNLETDAASREQLPIQERK